MEVLIGWTGSPASSPHFVSEVKRLKSNPSFYGDFLEDSHRCVEKLIHAFKTNNIKGVQRWCVRIVLFNVWIKKLQLI